MPTVTREIHEQFIAIETQQGFGNTYAAMVIAFGLSAFTARGLIHMRLAQREFLARRDSWPAMLRMSRRHKSETARFSGEVLARALLPLLDASNSVPGKPRERSAPNDLASAAERMMSGVDIDGRDGAASFSGNRLRQVLLQHGVEPFEPARGDAFDISRMMDSEMDSEMDETAHVEPADPAQHSIEYVVAETLDKGYIMHGERVLRRARVRVIAPK